MNNNGILMELHCSFCTQINKNKHDELKKKSKVYSSTCETEGNT